MRAIKITKNEAGQRLDKMLSKYLNLAGKSFLYKMMRKKNIVLNGKKCDGSEKLAEGDEVKLFLAEEQLTNFQRCGFRRYRRKNWILFMKMNTFFLSISHPACCLRKQRIPMSLWWNM
ncbi:hypothetical protein [Clostridium sp. AM58-1XD]|uniref:hypothetical protein n=1 Tax=Clostridium sp. AM58-1XD TaxID=2292307 RepID=UPI00268A4FA3